MLSFTILSEELWPGREDFKDCIRVSGLSCGEPVLMRMCAQQQLHLTVRTTHEVQVLVFLRALVILTDTTYFFFFFFKLIKVFKIGSHYVALVSLEMTM